MGLKLGRLLKKTVKSVVKRAPAIVGGFMTGGPMGAGLAFGQSALMKFTGGGVAAGVPSIETVTGVPSFLPAMRLETEGAVMPVAGAMPAVVGGLSRAVIGAIVRLASALGIAVTAANIGRVGIRLWRSVTALARRHPGVSVLAFLTGLGLAADEAAEFLFWGQAKHRRRRSRGISGRDIRTCRRVMRRMAAFQRDLGGIRRPGFRRRGSSRGGGVVIAQQD